MQEVRKVKNNVVKTQESEIIRGGKVFEDITLGRRGGNIVLVCVSFRPWPSPFISSQLVNRLMHHHFKHYYVHTALWHLVMRVRVRPHWGIRICAHTFQFCPSEAVMPLLYSKYQPGGNKLP